MSEQTPNLNRTPACGRRGGFRVRETGRHYLLILATLLMAAVTPLQAVAEQAQIHDVRILLVDGVYRLGARVEFSLNDTVREALENGVPLVLELQIQVVGEREYLWPETIAELHQRFSLRYHALSQRYLVRNLSTGVLQSFRFLDDALKAIGNIYDLPLLDANLLKADGDYRVRLRSQLDIESLPTPIRLWAYLGSNWRLNSGWYEWPLHP